ncbi:MAG: addiction module antidote protein [Methylococcaceae bacterium]
MTHFTHFDAADYLDNEETIAAYLTEALEDPAPDMFIIAVKTVARARGMTQLAKDSGLGRESSTVKIRISRGFLQCHSCVLTRKYRARKACARSGSLISLI